MRTEWSTPRVATKKAKKAADKGESNSTDLLSKKLDAIIGVLLEDVEELGEDDEVWSPLQDAASLILKAKNILDDR